MCVCVWINIKSRANDNENENKTYTSRQANEDSVRMFKGVCVCDTYIYMQRMYVKRFKEMF